MNRDPCTSLDYLALVILYDRENLSLTTGYFVADFKIISNDTDQSLYWSLSQ